MTADPIPFAAPTLGQAEIDRVVAVLGGPQLVHGPAATELEERFAARAGARHAVSLSSCTAGLHLSLLALGVGPGDTVVVPAMTHVATAHAVEYCGARPVFADVEATTGNIDPDAIPAVLDATTRVVMVVHYLGLPCDMDRIAPVADAAGVVVIEDAATALDATYGERKAGTLALAGCFSFYPTKHMTTAEGGMLVTDDDGLAAAVRQRKAFGYDKMLGERSRPGIYDVAVLGYNYRMSELHAAVGLAQLDRLDELQRARARNFAELAGYLADVDELAVMPGASGASRSSHYCLNVVLPRDRSLDRDEVMAEVNAAGVGTSVHYPGAVPLFSHYRARYGHEPGEFPVAEWLGDCSISLPVGPHLREGDPARIATAVKDAIAAVRTARS